MATLLGHMRAWQRVVDTGKPAIILEELQIPYKLKLLSFMELTGEELKKINGRQWQEVACQR